MLKERLFGPLKMLDTDFYVPREGRPPVPDLRQPGPGVLVPGNDLANATTKPTLFLGGHGLFGTIGDYERFCRMILNRGELDGVRVLKPETVELIFQNHLKHPTMKYGLGGIVNGEGSYGWGGADGTQFVIDRKHSFFALFMVQTQGYKAPTYPAFLALANEAAGITGGAGMSAAGGAGGALQATGQEQRRQTRPRGTARRGVRPPRREQGRLRDGGGIESTLESQIAGTNIMKPTIIIGLSVLQRFYPDNLAYYLVRRVDGTYEAYGTIDDPRNPVPRGASLAGTRTIECSPFPEDQGRVFYFGGYDVAGIRGAEHNTAWIYRGTLAATPKGKR